MRNVLFLVWLLFHWPGSARYHPIRIESPPVAPIEAAKLLLGIIGCGRVAKRFHLPALLKSSEWRIAARFIEYELNERRPMQI